jgi:hypothetical protein
VKLTCVIINRNNFRARIFNQIQIPARETSRSLGSRLRRSPLAIRDRLVGKSSSLVAVRAVDFAASPSVGIDSDPSEWGFVGNWFHELCWISVDPPPPVSILTWCFPADLKKPDFRNKPFKQLPFLSRKGHGVKCLGLEKILCSLLLDSRFEWEKSQLTPLVQWPRRRRNGHGTTLLGIWDAHSGLGCLSVLVLSGWPDTAVPTTWFIFSFLVFGPFGSWNVLSNSTNSIIYIYIYIYRVSQKKYSGLIRNNF